jgi:hypothetical protein
MFCLLVSTAYGADIYKWTGQDGIVSFADDIEKVPPALRDKVEVRESPSESLPQGQEISRGTSSPEQREVRVDIYGRDAKGAVEWEKKGRKEGPDADRLAGNEGYWRDRVRPWEERLEEATASYCGAQDEFMRIAGELSQMRFGSPTQYKMKIAQLDDTKFEMQRYQAQMTEAKEALEKISKEAKEAGADPDWLK